MVKTISAILLFLAVCPCVQAWEQSKLMWHGLSLAQQQSQDNVVETNMISSDCAEAVNEEGAGVLVSGLACVDGRWLASMALNEMMLGTLPRMTSLQKNDTYFNVQSNLRNQMSLSLMMQF